MAWRLGSRRAEGLPRRICALDAHMASSGLAGPAGVRQTSISDDQAVAGPEGASKTCVRSTAVTSIATWTPGMVNIVRLTHSLDRSAGMAGSSGTMCALNAHRATRLAAIAGLVR